MVRVIAWFDLPVENLDRAITFYEGVLGCAIERQPVDGSTIGVLPHSPGEIGGCLVPTNGQAIGRGALLYFDCSHRLEEATRLASELGGSVEIALESLGEYGQRAIVRDSEGNRIALHDSSSRL